MLLNKITEPVDIIVLAGQSNGEGYGLGPCDEPYKPTPDILSMRDTDNYGYVVDEKSRGTFNITMPRDYLIGITEERQNTSGKIGCLALSFARKYRENDLPEGRRVLIIHTAVGATGFAKHHWAVGDVLYERMLEMTETALSMHPDNRVVAVVWHQGEHDAIFRPDLEDSVREATHVSELGDVIRGFRAKFGEVPFIMGGFNDVLRRTLPKMEVIMSAMRTLACDLPHCGLVNAEGLLTNNEILENGDDYHFSRNSLNILGERYYSVYSLLK